MAEPATTPARGWVLYDGPCGFCSRWVPRWKGVLGRRGFAIETLQADWVGEKMGLTPEQLATDVRLLLVNGDSPKGADVYRYVMRRIWWAWPVYLLSSAPVLRNLFDSAYRVFADNRYWISRTCHMPAKSQ